VIKKLLKQPIVLIFVFALLLNLVWENAHSLLYVHYQSGEITQWILIRASIFDALLITLLVFVFLNVAFLKIRLWLSFVFGIIAAVFIEWYALGTGRWAYNELMPIIPLLKTGLTPTIQLGFLAYLILYFTAKFYRKSPVIIH